MLNDIRSIINHKADWRIVLIKNNWLYDSKQGVSENISLYGDWHLVCNIIIFRM
jgi:hypothetical protein